ncbi:MAG: hypothetical protein RMJ82_14525 [Gemmatales bacterium]|nr:hypothetical protein [Gemmatales bacterium]
MTDRYQLWFKSTLFKVMPDEDADTNPGRYGKDLAYWLRGKLVAKGFVVEEIIPEDWGWCILCKPRPFRLWVGCGNTVAHNDDNKVPLATSTDSEPSIIWTCFVQAEASLLARIFRKFDTEAAVKELYDAIKSILENEPEIVLLPEP